jgi:protein TonB
MIVAQGGHQAAQIASRSGPASSPSKASPGDSDAAWTNEPRGEPLRVTLAVPTDMPSIDADPVSVSIALPDSMRPVQPLPEPAARASFAAPALQMATPLAAEDASIGTPAPPTIASDPSDGNQTDAVINFRRNPPLHYPPEAAARRIQGHLLLRLRIEADGRVSLVEIVQSSGSAILDQAAMTGVANWRGESAVRSDRPVASTILLPVEFRLN